MLKSGFQDKFLLRHHGTAKNINGVLPAMVWQKECRCAFALRAVDIGLPTCAELLKGICGH